MSCWPKQIWAKFVLFKDPYMLTFIKKYSPIASSHQNIIFLCEYFNTIQRTILYPAGIIWIDLGVVSHITMVFYGSQFLTKSSCCL
jgi:hypothetical protein